MNPGPLSPDSTLSTNMPRLRAAVLGLVDGLWDKVLSKNVYLLRLRGRVHSATMGSNLHAPKMLGVSILLTFEGAALSCWAFVSTYS